ncbi:MAG TPA: crosslink repair DNA glycosylase YcaQ family protein [Bryobacteraceae bacterium]|jgi:hypothetical protein
MDAAKLRAWWFHRQGLDGAALKPGAFVESLTRCGWARSVGGSSPYLGFFARVRASRAAVDEAIAKLEIHELPAARSCTYVVPASDYALALKAGAPFADGDMKGARKLGVTDAEVEKLGVAVVDALAKGPLDPDGLKSALGAKVRNLGEEGKKKGVSTTLPLALGLLQTQGEIRRIPINGRLDQQRYRYAAWRPNPLLKCRLTQEEVFSELARRYFEWTGPATLAEFQWFSGLGVKAAKAVVDPLKLVEIEGGRLLPALLAEEFAAYKVPKDPRYALVGLIDSVLELRRNLKSLLDDADVPAQIAGDKGPVEVGKLTDLPSHAILDRGRLVGVWEFDPETDSIAWMMLRGKPDAAVKRAVREMEEFVRGELGDARSFSLDSPKSRAPRVAAIRART